MNVKEAIEFYQARGFNVIPLAKGSKEPLAGFKLERYFTEKYPADTIPSDVNIGIITGAISNLAVIDIDDPNKFQEYLVNYPTELVQKTPSGGYHLLYDYNTALPEIKKIEGGDFFNSKHYIVVAPSVVNGKQYEWISQGKQGRLSDSLFSEKIISIQSGKYTRKEIYDLLNYALENGKPMDSAGNDTILYGSTILAGDGWSKDAVLYLMKGFNKARQSPEANKTVEGMVARAFEYSKGNTKPQEITKSITEFNISTYGDMLTKYAGYKPSWLVDQWLPDKSIIICSALPERFKTWLAVDLTLSVASGLPFLDNYVVEKQGNVLVVQQEDFGPEFLARFKTVERAKVARANIEIEIEHIEGTWIYTNPYYIGDRIFFHEDAELSFDNLLSVEKLAERIREIGATLCVIDPFYSLSTNDDYFAKTAAQIRQYIKKIRNETGCTFFFVHHNKKSGSKESGDNLDRDQIYGSTFVSAVMEGAWSIGRDNDMGDTQVVIRRRFKTQKVGIPTQIKFHIDMSAPDNEAYYLDINDLDNDSNELVIAYLQENGPQTFTELFEAFQEKFGSKTTFTSFIKKMVGHGITQTGKRGKYSVEPDA